MGRQPRKQSVEQSEAKQDLLFLLSNVRARENGLVFFLELFTNNNHSRLGTEQFKIYKQQFLQKQKIYTGQIRQLLEKMLSAAPSNHFRSFWIKLKSIVRVSLERARTMGLLADSLASKYDEIMKVIDQHHEAASGIKQYLQIQHLIKKRTLEALMTSKTNFIEQASQDIAKNRSETFLKMPAKPSESLNFSPPHRRIERNDDQTSPGEASSTLNKLKSLTRVKRRGEKSKAKLTGVELKKAHTNIMRYERNLADLMDARFEFNIDKKKSKGENQATLYEALFDKNIANHKIITKYVHTSAKLTQFILNLRKVQSRQRPILSQNKLNKKARQQVSETVAVGRSQESKPKITRPKTSKNPKGAIYVKGRGERAYQLIKVM